MESPEASFLELSEACAELGWVIAMNESDNGSISGVIVGTYDYVVEVMNQLDDPDEYEIYEHGPQTEKGYH